MKRCGGRRWLRTIFTAAFWLTVWQIASVAVGQELILPSPLSVGRTLLRLCGERDFWLSAAASLWRVLKGLFWGVLLGSGAAVLMAVSPLLETALSPALRIVRATPVASFIILARLWISLEGVPGFIAMLIVVPVVSESLLTALRQVDPMLTEMGRAYHFSLWKRLKFIIIPSVTPAWSAACVTAMGLAWKSGVAAEVICQPRLAIGTRLQYSRIYLETPELFAWTAVVIVLSFLVEAAFRLVIRGRQDK